MDDQTKQLNNDQQVNNQPTEIEKLQKQVDEYLNGWKRAKADYINLKKESDAKMSALLDYATASFVVQMIPIYDNLKKALVSAPADLNNSWLEGVKQIKKQFEEFLKSNDITEMKTIGEKFNPEFHEAVSKEKEDGIESGIIISEASSGYLMKDKALIPAKVVVAE
jgi:molecular chaperone GrpE